MKTRSALVLACIGLALAAGCPQNQPAQQSAGDKDQSKAGQALDADALAKANLFNVKGMEGVTPYSLALDRKGTSVYTQFKIKGEGGLNTACFSLEDGVLAFKSGMAELPEVTRPYLEASTADIQCLTIGNYETANRQVNDRVYITGKNNSRMVEFNKTPGIPKDRPFDDFYDLSPFFSWDGKEVVVPLKYTGVVINTLEHQGYKFIKYPDFAQSASGMSLHALPNENGKRRVFASIWKAGLYEDDCRLYTLDLDKLEWTKIAQLKWIVYETGGPDLDNEPWLIAGSRGKEKASETKRTPLYGLLDPASGVTQILRSFGDPVWQIEVEPYGKCILYWDRQRKALVRLDPLSGQLDYDPRWFDGDATIITNAGCSTVLTWHRSMLLQAQWSGHEQKEGLKK